jgi:hypothetical protein
VAVSRRLLEEDGFCLPPRLRGKPSDKPTLFESRKEYVVVLAVVPIHATFEQAARSGLFGRLVEERVKLVDIANQATITKYRRLWSFGLRQDQKERRIFKKYQKLEDLIFDLQDTFYNVQSEWLQHRWVLDGHEESLFLEYGEEDNDTEWSEGVLGEMEQRTFRRAHSWVKKTLKESPRFTFGIVFRWCEKNCSTRVRKVRRSSRETADDGGPFH